MIDWNYIQQRHAACLTETTQLIALPQWVVQPQEVIPTRHKTKYGMADVHGRVHINQAFVGSSAEQLLEATIRHELAHLCVGLEQGHNARFRHMAQLFKAGFHQVSRREKIELHQLIGYKYALYACLVNQQRVCLKKVHRKHRKYTHYKPTLFRYLSFQGVKISHFEYSALDQKNA
ncbi:hypothetical protein ACFODZ_06190 [Marinicella sediminis]|uniref:SprT-like domain-containing protein n=1 Tax=Marinicella sediminis TaxID=1792834 RepID=A0ABV7J798_9GAMM|nr:hypothetical protein [Marinicella sediminis]